MAEPGIDPLYLAMQRNAAAGLSTAPDTSPEDAVRASDLADATSYPASYIARDLSDFEQKHKTALASDIMRQNPYIMRYINAHPMAASVSQNDWGNLDQYSKDYLALHAATQRPWWQVGAIGALHGVAHGVGTTIGGLGRLAGSEYAAGLGRQIMQSVDTGVPLTAEEQSRISAQVGEGIGGIASILPALMVPEVGVPLAAVQMGLQTGEEQAQAAEAKGKPTATPFTAGFATGATLGAIPLERLVGEGVRAAGPGLGQVAVAKLKEALKTGALMAGISEAGNVVNTEIAKATYDPDAKYSFDMQRMAANLIGGSVMGAAFSKVKPWIDAGRNIPKGVDPNFDQIIAGRAKASNELLDKAIESRLKTETGEAPKFLDIFLQTHPDATIELDGDAVRKLYGDKPPTPDDGILGWIPDLARQLAAPDHGDIVVSMRDYVNKVDKEVNDQLHDFRRVEPGGMTLEEAEESKAETVPAPTYITDQMETVRQAAGLRLQTDKGIIPEQTLTGQVELPSKEMRNTIQFSAKDALAQIDKERLVGVPKRLAEFFETRLEKMAGDVPIVALDPETMKVINKSFNHPNNTPGFYHPGWDVVVLDRSAIDGTLSHSFATHLLYHEVAHAATHRAIETNPELKDSIRGLMQEADVYLSDFDKRARQLHNYAFKDEHEFIAEAFSNPRFQEVLSSTPIKRELGNLMGLREAPNNAWDLFRTIVKSYLEKLLGQKVPDTVMDGVLKLGPKFEEAKGIGTGKTALAEPIDPEVLGVAHANELRRRAVERQEKDQAKLKEIAEKDIRQRQTREWKDNRVAEKSVATDAILRRPDIAADRFLREGMLYHTKTTRARLKEDMLTPEQKAALSPEHYGKEGLPPDEVGELFGYKSGDEMISHLAALHADRTQSGLTPRADINAKAEAEADRRMKAKYGDLNTEVLKELEDHVWSADELNLLSQKLLRLATAAKVRGKINTEVFKSMAREDFRNMRMREVDSERLADQTGRLGREIEERSTAEDHVGAYQLGQDRQISFLKTVAARQLDAWQSKFSKIAGRYRKKEVPGVAPKDVDWIQYLISKMGLPTGRNPRALETVLKDPDQEYNDLISYLESKDGRYGFQIFIPDFLRDPKWAKPVKDMTVGEYEGMSNLIADLDTYARADQSMTVLGEKIDRSELMAAFREQVKKQGTVKEIRHNPSKLRKMVGDLNAVFHSLIQMETSWNRLDLGDPYGVFNRTFSYGASDAANEFSALVRKYGEKLAEIKTPKDLKKKLDPIFTRPSSRTEDNPDGYWMDMTRENLLQVMRNMGTDSNFTKLAGGYKGPDESIEEVKSRIENWVNRNATKEDWAFIRKEGEIYEQIFREAVRMITGMGGRIPDVLPKRQVVTPHGTFDGWYHPMIYDRVEEGSSKKLMGKDFDPEEGLQDSGYFRATTAKGWEKQRTGYIAPVYLKMDRTAPRMTSVLRDVAMRPFVADAAKMFYDPAFRTMIKNSLGDVVRDKLDPYLKSLAGVGKPPMSSADAVMDSTIEFFRRNLISQLIGWNPNTLQKHTISAAINSAVEVGPLSFARELRGMLTKGDLDPHMSNWKWAIANSEELQARIRNIRGLVTGEYERLATGVEHDFREWLYEKGTAPIGFFDLASAVPTWIAQYKQAMEKLNKENPNINNHGTAVAAANRAVRRAHGSSAISSRPSAMRGGAMGRMFTSLYGFFNQALQRNYEAYWRTKLGAEQFSEGEFAKGSEQIAMVAKLLVTGVIAPALVEEMVTPYTNKDRDSGLTWSAKTIALGASGTIPLVREIVHSIVEGGDATAGLIGTEFKQLSSFASDIKKGTAMLDAQHGGKTVRDANSVFGLLTGRSNNFVGNLLKTTWDTTHQTKESPRTPYELGRDILKGHPREQKR